MKATANGAVTVTLDPEDSDLREVAVYGSNDAVPDNEILFQGDQLTVGFPPTVVADTATVAEDSTANAIDVLVNDTVNLQGQPPLTVVSVTNGAHGTVTIGTDGANVQYSPSTNYNGSDTFTYTAEDADGNQAIGTVTVTVTPVNDPPTANDDEFPIVPASSNNQLDVLLNDSIAPDVGETLRISAVGMGNRGGTLAIVSNGQFLRYTPNATFRGDETFIYTVEDGNGLTDTATVVVHVGDNNPVAGPDTATVAEDSTDNPLDVLANDQLAEGVEGNLLIVGTGPTSNGGTVTIADGAKSLLYTPAADFFGTETFTYRVVDGQGGEQTGNVTVTVTNVNDPPTANDDTATVDEDTSENIINVLANDSILPDAGETLTITAVGPTDNNGTVTIAPGGTHLLYTPAPDFFGTETFTYTVSDGSGGTDTGTVVVTVNNVNEQPIANDDTTTTVAEDSADNIINVLTNDTDPDGDTLTITAVGTGSQGGTIQIADGASSIRYTPAADKFGTETFTYTISDGNGGSDTATVTVTITPVNDNPDAVDDTLPVLQDSTNNTLDVLANDLIAPDEGETLTITAVGATNNGGTVTIANDNRSLVYAPAAGFVGTETFTYTISDGNGGSDTATVTVQVGNVNDPPVAVDDTATVLEDAAATTINVLTNDTDADGDTLTVTAVGATNHGGTVAIATDGKSVLYTPFANFNGTETFTYTVSDGNGGSDTATVTVTVSPVNDVPPSAPDTFTVRGRQPSAVARRA